MNQAQVGPQAGAGPGRGRAAARERAGTGLAGPGPGPARKVPPGTIVAATAAADGAGVIHGPPETVTGPR